MTQDSIPSNETAIPMERLNFRDKTRLREQQLVDLATMAHTRPYSLFLNALASFFSSDLHL